MPKAKKIYAVARGKNGEGIYHSWPECQEQVKGHKGARYKGFATREECEDFIRENRLQDLQIVGTQIRNPIEMTDSSVEAGTVPNCTDHAQFSEYEIQTVPYSYVGGRIILLMNFSLT